MFLTRQSSELALRCRRVQLPPEGLCDWSKDDGHILGRRSGLIASNMPLAGVDVALPLRDHLRCAGRIITLVECDLTFGDGDEDRPRMRMPPRRTTRRIVVCP